MRTTQLIGRAAAALAVTAAGFTAGATAAYHWLDSAAATAALRHDIGPWQTMKERAGFTDAFYIAQIARIGPFPNPPGEALYFLAHNDSSGAALQADKTYRVCGRPLPARFWSIAAYDAAGTFFANDAQRSSYTNSNVAMDAPDQFCIIVGPTRSSGNWLPTNGDGRAQLLLRLYQPAADIWPSLTVQTVPSIVEVKS
ncbi:MAG: DUF1214 domain-containing protein [Pseudomonadota bacterium]